MSANSLPVFYYIFVDDVVNIEYIAKQEWLVPLIFFFFSFKLFLSLICCTRTDMIFCTWTNTICTQAALCRRPPWPTITCQSSPPPHTGTSIISFPILFSMALDLEIRWILTWCFLWSGICLQPHLSTFAPPPRTSFNQDLLLLIHLTCPSLRIMIGDCLQGG